MSAGRLALCVLALAILPHLNSLGNGFTFDDVPIVAENPRIRSLGGVGGAWTSDWWNGERPQSLLYRPLTMASFGIDYAIGRWGEASPPPARLAARAALPFHVQNVLWHAAASAIFFLLLLELFGSKGLAFASAALFAVHPIHTEAIDGIVGRAELMAACFAFLALLTAWRVLREDPPGVLRSALAGAVLLLALLSKEQAIVVPVIVLFWLRAPLLRRRSVHRLLVSLGVAVVAYLALRTAVLGSPLGAAPEPPAGSIDVDNPVASATGASRWLTPVRVFGHTAGLLIFPKTLSADYSYDQLPAVRSLDGATSLSGLALAGLVALGWTLRRRAPPASFGILFFLLSWLIASNLPIVIGTIFGERLLYLPSAGVCLAIASLLLTAGRSLAVIATIALVLAGGARTWARNPDWKDNASLFASAALASPRSCKALNGHASELLSAGRPDEAVTWAERALAVYPLYPDAHLTLAKSLRMLAGEESRPDHRDALRSRARAEARQALASGGEPADVWSVLGSLALDENDTSEALVAFRTSLERKPRFVPSVIGLGVAHMRDGRPDAALAQFELALALDPGNPEALQNASPANLHGLRGQRFVQEKRLAEALAEFREAARLEPAAARSYLDIGTVLVAQADAENEPGRKSGLIDEAIAAFERARDLEPDNPAARMNLGIVYLQKRRDPAKVVENFRAYLRLVPDAPQRAQMEETIRRMDALR